MNTLQRKLDELRLITRDPMLAATILLAASIFHFGIIGIPELKAYLRERGVKVCGGEA